MKMIIPKLFAASIVLGLLCSARAELRVWTDQSGQTIEAEHVRTLDDKVVLRLADGSEIRVSLATLTERDRKYAVLLTPPRVEINVSAKTERDNKAVGPSNHGPGLQIQRETVQATVGIRKSSSAPYEAPLLAEVYLIGQPEQAEAYVILDHAKSKFQFTTENKNQHSFQSGVVNLKQLEAGLSTGLEYEGYIAIVRDRAGEILATKCSKMVFEKNAKAIIGSKKGDVFDEDFNSIERERARQKAADENAEKKKRFPGRRF